VCRRQGGLFRAAAWKTRQAFEFFEIHGSAGRPAPALACNEMPFAARSRVSTECHDEKKQFSSETAVTKSIEVRN
jgi:hypothetical protein